MSISPFHRSILFSRLPSLTHSRPTIHNAVQSLLLPSIQSRSYAKKKKKGDQKDVKIQMIDYALAHPVGNRPFKWSYIRNLRHWTIQQAWLLFKHKQKAERELELERQYNKIHDACEELKRCDERLFRIATDKKGVGTFPREMRIPTDTPPRGGFNEEWKRPKDKVVKKK
ncbi:hypothetical protein TWF106_001815 [Orbilia oligospora]|uniref:Large ribosomal subunit protein mL40 n=1 Tax=Orbilia oligospora TaxID=2813651 RepID=A0A6G1LSM7_ORBOL|nr:hypothetical protein TWF788_005303 [Orbilia oligospora]KAF3200458.1 hypothetical protein TWF679_000760 [Orbilia oligospora]KAF3203956.1 hypothetical protein TWF106_001815 [Orbilia oligospora]KAF3213915.1 hypothetical protein TWF191_009915 [Orbilia oligospora]KAF3233450.1 hypothetical protein TWF192_002159 [Orbilia oligospora]